MICFNQFWSQIWQKADNIYLTYNGISTKQYWCRFLSGINNTLLNVYGKVLFHFLKSRSSVYTQCTMHNVLTSIGHILWSRCLCKGAGPGKNPKGLQHVYIMCTLYKWRQTIVLSSPCATESCLPSCSTLMNRTCPLKDDKRKKDLSWIIFSFLVCMLFVFDFED